MLARAAMRNGLTHLATTSLPPGPPGLPRIGLLPSESGAVPTLKVDGCDGKGERCGGFGRMGDVATFVTF